MSAAPSGSGTLPGGAIGLFARHPTAANLLMVLMIVAGIAGITRLNTQFLPSFTVDWVIIQVPWAGATPEDVDEAIIRAVEPTVRYLDNVRRVRATAYEGLAFIAVEYEAGADLQQAVAEVEAAVQQVSTLPDGAERPEVRRLYAYEIISRVVVSGDVPERFLARFAKTLRDEMLALGLDRVEMYGLRDEEIHVELTPSTLRELDLTLNGVATRIRAASVDVPSGDIEGGERKVRSLGLAREARSVEDIEVRALPGGERLRLRDVAVVRDAFDADQATALRKGVRAIELRVMRSETADALRSAALVADYIEQLAPSLPPSISVEQYAEQTDQLRGRINLLLKNGISGLLIVLLVLFALLNARVAFWVAVGIPVSLLATLGVMLLAGQSINMVSLFGLIMAIGIVVDDAIVVGEHAEARRALGMSALDASVSGARRMAPPVFSSSLTTCAAFLPIFLIGGPIGQILSAIPLVTVAVIIASLFECFLVLPCHLRGALRERGESQGRLARLQRRINAGFERMREGPYRHAIVTLLHWRYATAAAAVAALLLSVGLVAGKRVGFEFFPSPEQSLIEANLEMVPGTSRERTAEALTRIEQALHEATAALSPQAPLVIMSLAKVGAQVDPEAEMFGVEGSNDAIGGIAVELTASDQRSVRTQAVVDAWKAALPDIPGIDTLTLREPPIGPRGKDVDIRLHGTSMTALGRGADEIKALLARFPGVSDIEDNLGFGKPEIVLEVTPRGRNLGFDTAAVGRQVRAALEGTVALRFAREDEEVAVRVQFPATRKTVQTLDDMYLRSPSGHEVPLTEIVTMREARSYAVIRRGDGRREVQIRADLDPAVTDVAGIIEAMEAGGLGDITERLGLTHAFKGKSEEMTDTFGDMQFGGALGLVGIYIVLAWVFGSFARPLPVMAVIPFGMIGAVVGHALLGFSLTILSFVALIGLAGIIVNDSIVLVTTVDERARSQPLHEAIVDGACDRLRAVLLTSLTTIGGLAPLLFERSLQAQFLIPMAITITFGLAVGTAIVLVLVPTLLAISDDVGRGMAALRRGAGAVFLRPAADR